MPRYYFHLHNDRETRDEEGIELPDLAAARAFAEREARLMAAAHVESGYLTRSHSIEVSDETGATRFVVRFGDVVAVRD